MSRSPLLALAVTLFAAPVVAGAQGAQPAQPAQPPVRIAASSFATVEVHINARPIGRAWVEEDAGLTGPSRIAISYGQPHARGRKVEGGLIPADTVWRFGANAATTLHTDVDLTLGTLSVPRGDYSLFVLYSKGGYQLVVNSETGQWGTDYDAGKDLGRIPLTARKLAEPEESLSIFLVPESAKPSQGYADLRGQLRIKWGATELSTPWQVRR
jgi:Protein of unknown function (DUF2911)